MNETLNYVNTVIIVLAAIGGLYAFLRGKKVETIRIQNDTIVALQQKVEVIESKLEDLTKENMRLQTVIELIQESLRKKGIHVTIDGNTIYLTERNQTTMVRKQALTQKVTPGKKTTKVVTTEDLDIANEEE